MRVRMTLAAIGVALLVGLVAEPAAALRKLPTYMAVPLNSPEPLAGASFGDHLGVVGDFDGDGVPEIAVSSEFQSSASVPKVGLVWIFDGDTRQLVRTIQNPDPQPNTGFGDSILGLGDVNGDGVPDMMIASAVQGIYTGFDSNGNPNTQPCGYPEPNGCNEAQGRVYIFSGRTGNLIRRIDDPTPQSFAFFGYGFSATPDGPDSTNFVVTAEGENVGLCDANGDGTQVPCPVGAAYEFNGKTGALIRRFDDPAPEPYAGFGGGETNSPGDVTGDGVGDILLGASSSSGGGNAYLFDGATGALVRSIPNPGPPGGGGGFGLGQGSGTEPGDVNGDGVPDLIGAAPGQEETGVMNAGALYLLSGKDGSLIRTLVDPNPQPSGSFGFNHASAGDLNGDGTPDIIGSRFVFPPAAYAPDPPPGAAAYIFDGRTGAPLVTLPGMSQNGPGDALVAPGDVNGDGYPDYFLGGRLLDGGAGFQSGQVIVELSISPATATTVACVPTSVLAGSAASCTATVTDTASGATAVPAGSVTFSTSGTGAFSGGGSCTLAPMGPRPVASCRVLYTPTAVGSGSHTVTATYPGDDRHDASSGQAAVHVGTALSTAPVISRFTVINKRFAATGTRSRRKHGTRFLYTVSEPGRATIVIAARVPGRKRGRQCVAPRRKLSKARKCTRLFTRGTLRLTSNTGANSVAFSGRIGSRALTPGRYQATLVATNAAGQQSKPRTIRFTIVGR